MGEFIAAEIFGIALNPSASAAATDGTFTTGLLAGKSVNVKLCGRDVGLLNLPPEGAPAPTPPLRSSALARRQEARRARLARTRCRPGIGEEVEDGVASA